MHEELIVTNYCNMFDTLKLKPNLQYCTVVLLQNKLHKKLKYYHRALRHMGSVFTHACMKICVWKRTLYRERRQRRKRSYYHSYSVALFDLSEWYVLLKETATACCQGQEAVTKVQCWARLRHPITSQQPCLYPAR